VVGGGNAYPDELIESINALSQLLLAEEDVSSTCGRIAELAVHAVEAADACSISLSRPDGIVTVGVTDEAGSRIDEIQNETNEGPCLSSIEGDGTYRIADVGHDETWPTFSKRTGEETGIKSMVAYALDVPGGARGALNLLARKVDAFDDDDVATGSLFAAQAAAVLASALHHAEDKNQIDQLKQALETRQVIGQAVGIIMASRRVTEDEAFEILVRISQDANIKIRDIARRVVDKSGDL
jgi:GAF domain-containing protein